MLRKSQAFLSAKTEEAFTSKRFSEETNGAVLEIAVKIYQDVATRDKVHFSEDLISYQTVVGEYDVATKILVKSNPTIGCLVVIG